MAEFITFLEKDALAELRTANSELTKMVANVDEVGKKMKNISTPSGADSGIKGLTDQYAKQEKAIQSLQLKLERASEQQQKTIEKTRLAEIKLAQDREKAFDNYSKQQQKELELVKKNSGLYNQAQIKVRELSEMYNDLAIKKSFGHKLSIQEEAQLHKLTNELNIYQSALKKVDADIQKNQRNVGNYASGWNGLGNSINQLTREMPAFANSAQTGFMAISNNLPILFDEINRIKEANKELLAQGQPIKSTFSQIAGSVLSWGTALSVGVTLLTVFGPKIWDMVSGSKATKKALEEEKKAREEKASIEKQAYEQQVKYASDEVAKSKILLETAKNLTLSMDERKKAVTELQQRYPDYLGKLSQEKILAGETAEMETKLNDALMKRALFLATQDKIIEKTKELVDAQMQYAKTNQAVNGSEDLYNMNANKTIKTKEKLRLATESDLQSTKALEQAVKNSNKTLVTSTSVYREKELSIRKQLDVLYAMLKANSSFISVVNEDTKAIKNNTKAKEDNIKIFTEDWFQKQISELEKLRGKVADTTLEYASYTNQINVLKMLLEQLQGKEIKMPSLQTEQLKALEEGLKNMTSFDEVTTGVNKLDESLKQLFQTTANGALSSFGMDSLIPMFDGTFNKMWETANTFNEKFAVGMKYIGDVAKETINFIAQQDQQASETRLANLEQEYKIAAMFAGDSATAKAELDKKYEEKRKVIQRQQAESQKRIAVFNSIVNTAQGVTAALAQGPTGIPLAIVIGALGAIQTAMISAQQIPQFYKGTENAPEGWAYTQEKGREIITDKHGNVKSLGSDGGAQLTYLSKGDKVFKNSDTEAMLFNKDLNNILTSNGISQPKIEVNNQGITDSQINKIVDAISSKEAIEFVRDEKGDRIFKKRQGQKVEVMNARLRVKGFDI